MNTNIPSQATSEKWIAYHKKKEEMKFQKIKEAENRKEERVQAKKKKEEEEKQRKKAREEAKLKKLTEKDVSKGKKLEKKKCTKEKNSIPIKRKCVTEKAETEEVIPKKRRSVTEKVEIEEGDFVIVGYDVGQDLEMRKYVAKVMKIIKKSGNVKISCLRPYQARKDIYIFPQIEDIDEIPFSKIQKKLHTPDEFRSKYHFNCNILL